jgi:hypothetical protein
VGLEILSKQHYISPLKMNISFIQPLKIFLLLAEIIIGDVDDEL